MPESAVRWICNREAQCVQRERERERESEREREKERESNRLNYSTLEPLGVPSSSCVPSAMHLIRQSRIVVLLDDK